jgi:hypothetical protein
LDFQRWGDDLQSLAVDDAAAVKVGRVSQSVPQDDATIVSRTHVVSPP